MKCTTRHPDDPKCSDDAFAKLPVTVQHSDTGKITKQTWILCGYHLERFIKTKGNGWHAWYTKKPFKKAHVIGYEEPIMLIEI